MKTINAVTLVCPLAASTLWGCGTEILIVERDSGPTDGHTTPDAASRDGRVVSREASKDSTSMDGGLAEASSDGSLGDSGSDVSPESCDSGAASCGGDCVDLMTDSMHCGRCGLDCLGASCIAGSCQPRAVAVSQSGVVGMAMDSANVYWTAFGGDKVMQASLDGGSLVTLASGKPSPIGMAVSASSVFWTTTAGAVSTPIGGGSTTAMYASGGVQAVALNSTSAYFTTFSASIIGVPLGGGGATTLASGQPTPGPIVSDETNVYWTNANGGAGAAYVVQLALAGGAIVTLATKQTNPQYMALDGSHVYWSDQPGGTIVMAPIGGGSLTTLASGEDGPQGIALDAKNVYWVTLSAKGAVRSVPKTGGTAVDVVPGQVTPVAIAVADGAICWNSGTQIMELVR